MAPNRPLEEFAPPFAADNYSEAERRNLAPFFTNLDQSVYAPLGMSPEVVGALCSRTSRAAEDLRKIFLNEYLTPFLAPGQTDDYGLALQHLIKFLHHHPIEQIFSNPRARSFYAKWLAQYGDDSIAQMAGMHLVFSSLTQVAIKHLEDQRIGLAPIEKSTRYVDYGSKINGCYRYYTDPTLTDLGLAKEYRAAMDGLFTTYINLLPRLAFWLQKQYPEEKPGVVEKKAFDSLRGLLPTSTLSQVAFFGNGQAFEYLVARSAKHHLGEIRWAAERAYQELSKIAPSFLRRLKDASGTAAAYQEYLAGRGTRVKQALGGAPGAPRSARSVSEHGLGVQVQTGPRAVKLLEYDPDGEAKVIAGMIFAAPSTHDSWENILASVKKMSSGQRRQIIDAYFAGREARWQKAGRALENVYVRFEILMNIGAWRDIHRHRMLTQQRQLLTCAHGYDVPPELTAANLAEEFQAAIMPAEAIHAKIAAHDPELAQYAVTLAHRLRFMQWTNLRQCFWEIELRTIPEGHSDYRHIEQEKFRLLQKIYPLLMEYMRVNLGEYDFARRGQEEKIQQKLQELEALKVT